MRSKLLAINWHAKEPVFSVDCHRSGRVATGGGDKEVQLWLLKRTGDAPVAEYLCGLARHQASVNCVRFAPDDSEDGVEAPPPILASAGDDGFVFVWQLVSSEVAQQPMEDDEGGNSNRESWTALRSIRAPGGDVYDLAWSPNSRFLLGGSTDNSAFIASAKTGSVLSTMREHVHYVQGVAWDPRGRYVVTQSSDRSVRVYKRKRGVNSAKCLPQSVMKYLPGTNANAEPGTAPSEQAVKQRMYLDESVPTFFRRPCWSPEGSLLVTPTGTLQQGESDPPQMTNAAFVFARGRLSSPCCILSGHRKPVIAARFSPVLYSLGPQEVGATSGPLAALGYRMLLAVATLDSVTLYDTRCDRAVASAAGLHLAELTDLSWTKDGNAVVVSSRDGFCSVITLDPSELGDPLPKDKWPTSEVQRDPGEDDVVADEEEALAETTVAATNQQKRPADSPADSSAAPCPPAKRKRIQPTLVLPFPVVSSALPQRAHVPALASPSVSSASMPAAPDAPSVRPDASGTH